MNPTAMSHIAILMKVVSLVGIKCKCVAATALLESLVLPSCSPTAVHRVLGTWVGWFPSTAPLWCAPVGICPTFWFCSPFL